MKIFVLLSRIPYPLEKGDKLRAFNHIKYLSTQNEIILAAINDKKIHPEAIQILKKYCRSVTIINLSPIVILINLIRGLFSKKPFQVEYFYFPRAKKIISGLIRKHKPEHIFCQLIRVSEYVKHYDISKTLDYQDAFSKGIERRISISPFYLRWLLKIENKRLLKYERDIFSYFDHKLIISENDRSLIPHSEREKIHIIPNGVDRDYFKPMQSSKEYDLIFAGNMGYYPNIISALYLVKKILPLLIKKFPDIRILIAGANPHKKILSLRSKNVVVSGWVDDIRNAYAASKIMIAPMQLGTGMQNKLLEAMAMKLPCIASPLAANTFDKPNDKELIICQKPKEYAFAVVSLLTKDELYSKTIEKGYDFVLKHYNWEETVNRINLIINKKPT